MINYSIYIAGSKPGTKKADIKETKAYGTSQIHEALSFDDFCQHIADHNSPFSAGAIFSDHACLVVKIPEAFSTRRDGCDDKWILL